jgi:SNF2 family DNA or RNA helicase
MDYVYGRAAAGRMTSTSSRSSSPRQAPVAGRRLVLHGAWLLPTYGDKRWLALWAETETAPPRRHYWIEDVLPHVQPRPHRFAAKYEELVSALDRLWRVARPGVTPRRTHTRERLTLWLPALGARPLPSRELACAGWAGVEPDAPLPEGTTFKQFRMTTVLLDPEAAATLLAGLPLGSDAAIPADDAQGLAELRLGVDLRYWSAAAAFALDLLVRQHFIPGARELAEPRGSYWGGSMRPGTTSTWLAALGEPETRERFDTLSRAMPDLCRATAREGDDLGEPHPPGATTLLEDFLHTAVNARIAAWLAQRGGWIEVPRPQRTPFSFGTGTPRSNGNPSAGGYYASGGYYGGPRVSLATRWLEGLARPRDPLYLATGEERILLDGLARWHAGLSAAGSPTFRLCFRLSPPGTSDPDAADDPDAIATSEPDAADAAVPRPAETAWRLEFLLQARDDLSLLVPLEEIWRQRGAIARFVDRRFDHPHEHVLAGLGQAAQLFPPLTASLSESRPTGCLLAGAEAYLFLRDALPRLEEAGFGVLAPPWWKRGPVKPTVRMKLKGTEKTSTGMMGLGAIVGYDYSVALGGQELSRAELEQLVTLKEPLVRLRGQWVELKPEQVEAALRFVEEHGGPSGTLSLGEALRVSLTGTLDGEGAVAVALEEVSADGWIGDLLGRLRAGEAVGEIAQPDSLHGTLRPYQVRGLGWLSFLSQYGLGACLADDMGLGKTICLLSLLLRMKEAGQLTRPALLACPTSVVGNWEHEAARFAPDLRVLTHHGASRVGRTKAHAFADEVARHDLVLTTYSLLPRDEKTLAGIEWGVVALDEAQNIKNAEAKQSRSARKLRAPIRVALTGTPVENRLSELWSILDFLNPGFLGSEKRFRLRFGVPIELEHNKEAAQTLQSLVRPFILRRLKTDPNVIQDLPEKLEMREYCPLTREQVTLYEAVVRDGLRKLEEAVEPMARRGVILSMLMRLKQVCNHPAHFLGDGSDLPGRSGKLTRLEELVEELLSEGDRALIFTQFTALGERLQPYLHERFGTEVLYLHGGVPQRERVRLVERFQSGDGVPLFLLSLKAGGTGLNLTAANHVIHFDRWWNPAVENQATDRAFRIGQTRNVQVRKLICQGTLEERIDAMIEAKAGLAEQVIGAGEAWLTELSTAELRDLFSLRATALAE